MFSLSTQETINLLLFKLLEQHILGQAIQNRPTANEMVAFFQDCIDWGVQAGLQYLSFFGAMTLAFILFKR
jgi:hypothetical protein